MTRPRPGAAPEPAATEGAVPGGTTPEGTTPEGTTAEGLAVADEVLATWAGLGLRGGFWARHLTTGEELGFAADEHHALASVAKLPLALVVLDRVAAGALAADRVVEVDPALASPGPTGLSLFRHPARLAVEDLVLLALSLSDNAAADALFDLVGPEEVQQQLDAWDVVGIVVRHRVRALQDAVDQLDLAVRAGTSGGGHVLPQLDVARASSGTARGLVDLLDRIWSDRVARPAATARLRELLAHPVARTRIAGELHTGASTVAGKTGTFLHLRHDTAVVTTSGGDRVAVAALTASGVPARHQPEVDQAVGHAARAAVEALRL